MDAEQQALQLTRQNYAAYIGSIQFLPMETDHCCQPRQRPSIPQQLVSSHATSPVELSSCHRSRVWLQKEPG